MTDSVDSAKSAFQRLSTLKVRSGDQRLTVKSNPETKQQENTEAAPVRIFNEVSSKPTEEAPPEVAVEGLQRAVSNLGETKATIERIGSGEVPEIERENRLAAQAARITDVNKASDLADELKTRILNNAGTAKQAFELNAQTVQDLLR